MSFRTKLLIYTPSLTFVLAFLYTPVGVTEEGAGMTTVYLASVFFASLFFAAAISFFLGRSLEDIIQFLAQYISSINTEEGLNKRVEIHKDPTFNALSKEFNTFVEKMEKSVGDYKQSLSMIDAGVLLIDENLTIIKDYSPNSAKILGLKELVGSNLEKILIRGFEQNIANTMKNRLESAFDLIVPDQFQGAVKDIPQKINFTTPQGDSFFLSLCFNALIENFSIKAILITFSRNKSNAKGVSNEDSHEGTNRVLQQLVDILNDEHDRTEFKMSIEEFTPLCEQVGRSIKTLNQQTDLDQVFRQLHTIKGGVRNFKLEHLSHFAHEIEKVIAAVRDKTLPLEQVDKEKLSKEMSSLTNGFKTLKDVHKLYGAGEEGQNDSLIHLWDSFKANIKKSVNLTALDLSKKVQFELNIHTPMIGKDLSFIKRILIHMVRNALDHGLETPEERKSAGKNEIGHLRIDGELANDNQWHFRISDDGRGINHETLKAKAVAKGMTEFAKKENLTNDELLKVICHAGLTSKSENEISDISGHGVGMDSVKKDIDSINGTMALESSVNTGSSFTISWAAQENYKTIETPQSINNSILIIDDEPDMISILKAVFRKTNIDVHTALTIKDAKKVLTEKNIAVVVTDYRLDVGTGLQFLAFLATEYPNIVSIVVSGFINQEFIDQSKEIGVFAAMPKPVKSKEIRDMVHSALEQYNRQRIEIIENEKDDLISA